VACRDEQRDETASHRAGRAGYENAHVLTVAMASDGPTRSFSPRFRLARCSPLGEDVNGVVVSATASAVKWCGLGAVIAAAYQLTNDYDAAHRLGLISSRRG
jgi:hypothetical protein